MTTNQVNKPKEVVFRQTLDVTRKRWDVPKRLDPSNGRRAWKVVNNLSHLMTKRNGISMALWRLQKIMKAVRDTEERLIWKTVMSKRKRVVIKGSTLSTWTLTCTRIRRDMSGVM
jgi:hypothetical protein